MAISKKHLIGIISTILFVLLISFQLKKREQQLVKFHQRELALSSTKNPLSKVLVQLPIYRDSVYRVYLIKFNSQNKLIFLKKGNITEKQKESSFFVHLYPKDKSKLHKGFSHIAFNFKNNVTSFNYKNEEYFVSETNLPDIMISKLNLGQYGFRGDNSVSWQIPKLLIDREMWRIVKENKSNIELFNINEESF